MTGGLIQLVAYGIQDIFLTQNPQITFFKIVYRRHTNFSMEAIPQYFTSTPTFGKKITCPLARAGDLIRKMYLVLSLPKITKYISSTDKIYEIAWARKIAFALIKYVEIEIGGQLIDRHYGEWMNVWFEVARSKMKGDGYDKMIGNVEELTSITESKDPYQLYIPMQFWFCKFTGSALPMINLYYNEVKINIELNPIEKCYITHPKNYITVNDDLVPYTKGEYIEQTVNGKTATGIFIKFDRATRKLYYTRLSSTKFKGIANDTDYLITGKTSKYPIQPTDNEKSNRIPKDWLNKLELKDCFMLVEYFYIDREERIKFAENKHEYLIEQVQHVPNSLINNTFNEKIRLTYDNTCKELFWMVQLEQATKNNDWFNYTDKLEYENGAYTGKSIINEETIILNGHERLSKRPHWYFNYIQPLKHHLYNLSEGINMYSFSLFPEKIQPSGTCNFGVISDIEIDCKFHKVTESVKFKSYAVVYNILRIADGLSGLVFNK